MQGSPFRRPWLEMNTFDSTRKWIVLGLLVTNTYLSPLQGHYRINLWMCIHHKIAPLFFTVLVMLEILNFGQNLVILEIPTNCEKSAQLRNMKNNSISHSVVHSTWHPHFLEKRSKERQRLEVLARLTFFSNVWKLF